MILILNQKVKYNLTLIKFLRTVINFNYTVKILNDINNKNT